MENTRKKNNVLLCCAAIVLSALIGLGMTRDVSAVPVGCIKGSNVNIRSDAGATCKRVATLNTGDVAAVQETKQDAAGKTWYHIFFVQGGKTYEGYVFSDYLVITGDVAVATPAPAAGTPKETAKPAAGDVSVIDIGKTSGKKQINRQGTVQADNVNIRKGAVTGVVIGSVSRGDTVFAIRSKKAKDGKKWYKISFLKDGTTKKGWIRSDFVKLQKKAVQTVDQPKEPAPSDTPPDQTADKTPDQGSQDDALAVSRDAVRLGSVKADDSRVRKNPVNGRTLARLSKGQRIGIIKKERGKDGKKWYYVSYAEDGETKKGWLRYDRVKLGKKLPKDAGASDDTAFTPLTDEEFEAYMTEQGFPETYKTSLRALHQAYPKWTFRAVATGLNFQDALDAESKTGLNLVSKLAVASWKSTESTAYNWKKNTWYTFDGGSWVAASKDLIAYHMDPRNFLDDTSVFQFESLEYETYQNEDGVKELLKNSFMKGDYTEPDGTVKSYAASFVEIGKLVGISPYHLAARCYQEQGLGTSASISGNVTGYENIFNYYNIGAYASGKNTPSKQGLIYASTTATKEELNYDRPWNTRYKSLLGGAKYVAAKYVKMGQNTLYFQKFNVVNTKNGIYKHQYMTNIQAAAAESQKMSKAYTDKDTQLVFYIPVYLNMPTQPCAKPTGNLNPNNYLSSISVDGYELTPAFDGATEEYSVTVDADTDQVTISAAAVAKTSTVAGAGVVSLVQGTNDVILQCTSQSGEIKNYTVHITR